MRNIVVQYRRLSEIATNGRIPGIDGFSISQEYESTLKANPFRDGQDVVFVKLGLVDGRFVGQEYVFPLNMSVNGKTMLSGSGSNTYVEEWARKSGIGLEFAELHPDFRDGNFKVTGGSGLSQMSVRMHKLLGCNVFEYPRFVMLLKSRALIETKLRSLMQKILIVCADGCIWLYSQFLKLASWVCSGGINVSQVNPTDFRQINALGELAASAHSRFYEVHDSSWFKWILNNSFSKYGSAKAYILNRKSKPVGFFVVKIRFHEQASQRGFRNVWLGSVIEWGALPGYEQKLMWKIMAWVAKARKDLDAVEFPVFESFAQKFLRRLGWQHVGDANFCYRIRPDSGFVEPEGMDNPANWRLRPAMGDVGLN